MSVWKCVPAEYTANALMSKIKYKKLVHTIGSRAPKKLADWSFYVLDLQRTATKCTTIYNARADLQFCSLSFIFGDVCVGFLY